MFGAKRRLDLRNEDRTDNELCSGLERALSIFHVHNRAAANQNISVVLLAEIGNAVYTIVRIKLKCRSLR